MNEKKSRIALSAAIAGIAGAVTLGAQFANAKGMKDPTNAKKGDMVACENVNGCKTMGSCTGPNGCGHNECKGKAKVFMKKANCDWLHEQLSKGSQGA